MRPMLRQPKNLPLTLFPADILRKTISPVIDPADEEVCTLIGDMRLTMVAAQGIGLAANQVGKDLRVFVIDKELAVKAGISDVFINPEIVESRSKKISTAVMRPRRETSNMEEGCLSVPGKFGEVERPNEIIVSALDEHGKIFTVHAKGLLARVLQHEMDHLNGMLFVDKI